MSAATIQRNKQARRIKSPARCGAPRLLNGDHLTVPEFERRYWAMPEVKKAELIEGIVVMSPPVSNTHGEAQGTITYLLKRYAQATPGVSCGSNTSVRLDGKNEYQPEVLLRIESAQLARSRVAPDGLLDGGPEFLAEIAVSSAAYDLHEKKAVYQRCLVPEYFVWQVMDSQIQAVDAKAAWTWNNLRFRSASETKIAAALDKVQGVWFLPNCRGRVGAPEDRKNREADFLVCHKGKWGILEVDGEAFHPPSRTTEDHERDRLFKLHGMIVMEDSNGQPNTIGSGFVVGEGYVASNFHVVEGASRGFVKRIGDKMKYEIDGVAALDQFSDLVVLKVRGLSSPKLGLADSDHLSVGQQVFAVGNPQGLEGTFSQGIVSSIRETDGGKLLQITAPISPGSSGGPILNDAAEVVGVTIATYRGGQNLNFAIPGTRLATLLSKDLKVRSLSESSRRTSTNSILAGLTGRITEGIVVRKFDWPTTVWTTFRFSVLNQLRQPVRNPQFLVVFFDDEKKPIDFKLISMKKTLPGGLATWIDHQSADVDTAAICNIEWRKKTYGNDRGSGSVEVRVLGFELVEEPGY